MVGMSTRSEVGLGAAALVALLLLVICPASSLAQVPLPPNETSASAELDPGSLDPAGIRDAVARLSDAEVRALLLERLDAVATAEQDERATAGLEDLFSSLQDSAATVHTNFVTLISSVTELPEVFPRALTALRDGRSSSVFLWMTLGFALMLAVGWLVEQGFRRLVADLRAGIQTAQPATLLGRIGYLVLRLGLDVAGLVLFAAGALGVFFLLWQGHEETRTVITTYLLAVFVVRLYGVGSRFSFAPHASQLRLFHLSDADACYLHQQNMICVSIAAFGFFTCSLLAMLTIQGPVHVLLVYMVGFALFSTIVWTTWRGREAIRADLRGETPGRIRTVFAQVWPGVLIAFVIGFYVAILLAVLSGGGVGYAAGLGTLFLVVFLPHIDAMLERAAQHEAAADGEQSGTGRMQVVLIRALRIAIVVGAIILLANFWGLDLVNVAQSGVGGRIVGVIIDVGLAALVAYLLWEFARITIDRRMAAEGIGAGGQAGEPGDEGGAAGSRLGTLLPLLRATIQITIAVMAVLLVLAALGVNIGPLLAGAGVVGIAIGFGAQTLVKDIVSGVFFLVDDAFRVGEYIDVGAAKGTVEKISIRSLRLRHHLGALHTVPFGEIQTLTNYSRDWVVMRLEFRVPFDTDLGLVKRIFKQIGKDLLQHPDIGPDILQPFKSQGVYDTDDSALIIRGKFMAKPGKQFLAKREIYMAVQKAFAENGIPFADRRVTVHVPGVEHMPPEQRKLAESAAASAVLQEEEARTAPAAAS